MRNGGLRQCWKKAPWGRAILGGLLPMLFFLAACAGPGSLYQSQPAANLSWPQQIDGPRVVWVKNISGYQDAGIAKSFWKRALEFFIGEDERRLVRPYGILFDGNERLYIADPGRGIVHSMDIRGGVYTVIGGEEGSPLRTPIGLAEDEAEHLYITDSTTATVYRYDIKDGTLKPFLVNRLQRPTGIAFNEANKLLYIVDTTGGLVVAVDAEGRERIRFGGEGEFNHPTDIAIDDLGQIYITDALNYKIRVFTAEGAPITQFGAAGDTPGYLYKPKGVAVDSRRHIYVCDAMLDAVQIFDDSGRILLSFGANGPGNGQFWMPSGLFIDRHDYIFVADTYNRRIQVFRFLESGEQQPGTGAALPGNKDE